MLVAAPPHTPTPFYFSVIYQSLLNIYDWFTSRSLGGERCHFSILLCNGVLAPTNAAVASSRRLRSLCAYMRDCVRTPHRCFGCIKVTGQTTSCSQMGDSGVRTAGLKVCGKYKRWSERNRWVVLFVQRRAGEFAMNAKASLDEWMKSRKRMASRLANRSSCAR